MKRQHVAISARQVGSAAYKEQQHQIAGGVSKQQAKKDQKRLKALEDAKREEANKRVKEQEDYENLLEKRANMTVSMNLASHRGMDDRKSAGYDAV